jgi:hypothetical protein
MTHKQLLNALNTYKGVHYSVALGELARLNPEDADIEDDVSIEFELNVKQDLDHRNFTKEEIDEILEQSLTKATAYKFMAYFISQYDEFRTVEELKKAIGSYDVLDIDEFDEQDFEEIIKARALLN